MVRTRRPFGTESRAELLRTGTVSLPGTESLLGVDHQKHQDSDVATQEGSLYPENHSSQNTNDVHA